MMRISRMKNPPSYLKSREVYEQRQNLLGYLRRDDFDRRVRRDGLNEDIFFDPQLRSALETAFKGKCAFCESYIGANGRVVHFRPLRHVRGNEEHEQDYYLWLAFEWRNLFYACDYCNKAKGDYFPIAGKRADYLATYDEVVRQEAALLIDPTAEDPSKHLKFLIDGSVKALSLKGSETISIFYLNRPKLVSGRNELFAEILESFNSRFYYKSLSNVLTTSSAYFGAALQILKRVAKDWLPGRLAIKGNNEAFIRNFDDALFQSDSSDWDRLNAILRGERDLGLDNEIDDEPVAFRQTAQYPFTKPIAKELESISISNFKIIENLSFQLPGSRTAKSGAPAIMILGENAAGKSSILCAIALALIGSRESQKFKKYFAGLVRSRNEGLFDQLDGSKVEVKVNFHFDINPAIFNYDPLSRSLVGSLDPSMVVLGYGARRFFNPKIKSHGGGMAARVKTLFDPLATIPYPGEWLRSQTGSRLDNIMAALRVVLALDDDDELIVEHDRLAVRANGSVTPIDALSEGYRSVFIMTVDIIRELLNHYDFLEEAQAIVLIDEIETHLHPRWKMQVMTSLRKVLPKVQFIVTTHDPLCIRGMDDGEVIVLQRDQNQRISILQDLPSVSGMTAEQLLVSDYFGLASTADPGTEIKLATISGDIVRRRPEDGGIEASIAVSTSNLIGRLTLGDTPTQQIIQSALIRYLEERESRIGNVGPELRYEAVDAVLKALSTPEV